MCTGKIVRGSLTKCYSSSDGGGGGGKVLFGVNDSDFNVWLTITFWKEQLFLLFSPTYNFVLFLDLQ